MRGRVRESRMELSSVPTDAELQMLASEVAEAVLRCRLMLVTAESCSGGWIAKTLTDARELSLVRCGCGDLQLRGEGGLARGQPAHAGTDRCSQRGNRAGNGGRRPG